MNCCLGQIVVLRSRWNIHSCRVGIVIKEDLPGDIVLVLWTVKGGVKMKYHLQDAIIPVTNETLGKIKERICNIK